MRIFLRIIFGLFFIANLTGCRTILTYQAKIPENYNATYVKDGDIMYEENGVRFYYKCASSTRKSAIYNEKPNRGARFRIMLETHEPISNISIGTCKFENKQLNYVREKNYPYEKVDRTVFKAGIVYGDKIYEIWIDDFVPKNLFRFNGLFDFKKLKGTEYETEFTVNYEINNKKYVTILKGIFWCYYVSGPIWLWT
jgi:hypothetical protein